MFSLMSLILPLRVWAFKKLLLEEIYFFNSENKGLFSFIDTNLLFDASKVQWHFKLGSSDIYRARQKYSHMMFLLG